MGALLTLTIGLAGCDSPAGADAATAETTQQASDVELEVRQLELARLQALVDVDMQELEAVHAADFVLIPPPGVAMTRDEYLAAVESGDLDYLAFEPVSRVEVSVHGDAAFVTYRSRIHIAAEGTGELDHEAWHTYLYVDSGDA